MKKTYKLRDLECAHCAAKMEHAINQMPEVKSATVNFMQQKLSVELEDESIRDVVMQKVIRAIQKVEPDCEVVLK